jgi:hypothetical protein
MEWSEWAGCDTGDVTRAVQRIAKVVGLDQIGLGVCDAVFVAWRRMVCMYMVWRDEVSKP